MTETNSKTGTELFVVFGGKVADTRGKDFTNLKGMDVRGFFHSYQDALAAWRAASQMQVDDAFTKYVIVRLW